MAACLRCGEPNARRARFCSSCGFALAIGSLDPRPGEELKVVTVIFVDLVSFTGHAEGLHPEDVARLLRPYYSRVRAELERFGGRVEKFIGDAVVAIFGAPVAHEDDPERGVRAAFAVREAMAELNAANPEFDLRIRIGVNTGPALVSLDVHPSSGEGLVAGDIINVAARLQSEAPINGILVGSATRRATEHVVDYGATQGLEVKGKSGTVEAALALAARPRHGFDLARRGFVPLHGRRHELERLLEEVRNAIVEPRARLVTLLGPPGIGKTRLLWELFHSGEGPPVLWRQGRCLPYGEGVPYWAFADIVKAQAAILESDTSQVARRKLRRSLEAVTSDIEARKRLEAHLRPLVGLGGPGAFAEDRRTQAFAAWVEFVAALARVRPLILVLEDLHWADEGLLDFVEQLPGKVGEAPLALVCAARPELLERRPGWADDSRIELEPLSRDDTVALLESLLERAGLAEADAELLAAHAAGNPLFAEEYVRMLEEAPLDAARAPPIPESVQSIIAARLDALPLEEKGLLQAASVIGRGFWTGAVAAVGGLDVRDTSERLDRLRERRLIRPQPRSSIGGEEQHTFWHAFVRDVAYAQLPRAIRAEKHRAAAEWIEAVAPDRAENLSELLAHHYACALEFGEAAGTETGELRERARQALRAAGDRALGLYAFAAAARHYRAAAELCPIEDPERATLLLRLGSALFWSDAEGGEELAEARALLLARDDEAASDADVLLSRLALARGERDEAFAYGRRAVETVPSEASRARAAALSNLSGLLIVAGDGKEAARLADDALAIARELGLDDLRAHAMTNAGLARSLAGDAAAVDDLDRAADLAEQLGSPEAVRGLANLGSLLAILGDLDGAAERFERARGIAERLGHGPGLAWLEGERLHQLYWEGDLDTASTACGQLLAKVEAGDERYTEIDARLVLAAVLLARREGEPARVEAARALELARRAPDPQVLYPALALAARTQAAAGDGAAAVTTGRELLAEWKRGGRRLPGAWTADLAFALADVQLGAEFAKAAEGAPMQTRWLDAALRVASGDFATAAEGYTEIGSRPDEAEARARSASAATRVGSPEAAG